MGGHILKKVFSKLIPFTALLLIFVLFATTFSTAVLAAGDIDGSGRINASDAVYLLYNTIYGDDEYPLKRNGDVDGNGIVDSDDAVYLLYNTLFGPEDFDLPDFDGTIPITLNNGGTVNTYNLTPGDELPTADTHFKADLTRYKFIGWYDKTLTTCFTTVPDYVTTLYAVYDGYTHFNFETGTSYDPNKKGNITPVTDPFDGEGTVMYSPVINKNDNITKGYYRGIVPGAVEGVSSKGFVIEKGHTYEISFIYRYADTDPSNCITNLTTYAVSPAGVYTSGNKTQITLTMIEGSEKLTNKGGWATVKFKVTNTTDHPHLYIRFMGGSSSTIYNLYIDDLTIYDITETDADAVKLVNGGIVESTDLAVGDTLPVLDDIYDRIIDRTFAFMGWYDKTLTTQYTAVDASVDTYYARFENYTAYSYELGGMFDPYNRYSATSTGIPSWYRAPDPTGADNICMRAKLKNNGNNTHFAPSLFEGSDEGYQLLPNRKYLITFDYYFESSLSTEQDYSFRGSKLENIGKSGNKTDQITSGKLYNPGAWHTARILFITEDDVEALPYLIILSQGNSGDSELMLYLDNLVITEYAADENITVKTYVDDINYNNNGIITHYDESYIGAELEAPITYNGAEFLGWYNDTLTVPYSTVPTRAITLYAKYDSTIINFENGGYFDPNGGFGKGHSPYTVTTDPTKVSNRVIKVSLEGNDGNNHFALAQSGYSNEDGYKLTVGNTYTISFMYYAENLNSNGVNVQFRGCKSENIGKEGGKSSGYGAVKISAEGVWTNASVTFTYSGTNLTDIEHPYLIMLAQDGSQASGAEACTATVYFDDIVVKETVASETYTRKTVKIGNIAIGAQYRYLIWNRNYEHNVVIPSQNFSYVAMMQIEELTAMLNKAAVNAPTFNIVKESNWTQKSNQFNIFVGDVAGHSSETSLKIDTSSFTEDDYAIRYGNGNVYINGGSPYATAMGVSEFAKAFKAAADGTSLTAAVNGKYSEKIDSYSAKTYYRPTFLEDFNGTEVNTDIWKVFDGSHIEARGYYDEDGTYYSQADNDWQSMRSAEHTYIEDGKLVIEAAYSKEEKMFYGGMLRTHGKMEYRYGYLEVSCITPHGEGLWTATWATPHSGATGLYRNEIDVNECFGNARYTAFNMHTWPTTAGANFGKTHYSLDGRGYNAKKFDSGTTAGLNNGFHTFGYLWTEDKGVFTADGMVQFEYKFDKSSNYYKNDIDAFNDKMSLIFSMTVGNPSSGADPILGADYWTTSNKYIAEYIHIYQIDGQEIYFTPPEKTE